MRSGAEAGVARSGERFATADMLADVHPDRVPVEMAVEANGAIIVQYLHNVGLIHHHSRSAAEKGVVANIDDDAIASCIDRGSVGQSEGGGGPRGGGAGGGRGGRG